MSYRFYVTMNPPAVAYNWQYGGGYTLPDIREVEGELVEVDDNGHLMITDAADQVVFAAANGAWLSCNLATPSAESEAGSPPVADWAAHQAGTSTEAP